LAGKCSACGSQLSPTAKFCPQCAHPVGADSTASPRFGTLGSYTPKYLAERILTSKAALEGERKQVTVLFADLKGSMELLADRDPEEARKILDPVLELMMEAVHHYEGTVNQVMGDGIMALFGAPLAHEDHAVRACYAALRMQENARKYAEDVRRSQGVEVQIRVGMNSGDVVVRSVGSDLRMDYTAVGQTTHLAARMEQLATPGTIRLTSDTLRLSEGFIDVKPLGCIPVKGLAGAVEIYEMAGAGPARTKLQAAARRGLTRLVGRSAELESLRRLRDLAGSGHGQVVAIVGEAGVGKSRLLYEFTHSHRVEGWLTLWSASVSYGKATSYLPLIDLLKSYFKIQERDDRRTIREKVTGKLLALAESLRPMLPALLALLDVPVEDESWRALDPAQRRQDTLDAVQRLLLRQAREQPLLLVFEDLHWIDSETQALLDALVDGLGSAQVLLLVNYRPEYQHAWAGKTFYSQMRLDALPADSTGELLDALLGDDPDLAPLKQLLLKRGNPFFLEETVRTLVETKTLVGERGRYRLAQPLRAIQVPSTVQAVLAARIDRLPPEDKGLLQIAAVVGKDVPFALLRAIADLPDEALRHGLDRLQAAEFLCETGLYPDLEYSFKHALTHEVTYAGLLQAWRRAVHTQILSALESLFAGRLEGQVERLAHHAWHGEMWEKATAYMRQAGAKAEARSAQRETVACLEQAIAALRRLPETPERSAQEVDIRFDLRNALLPLGELEPILDHLRAAEALARALGDQRRLGRIAAYETDCLRLVGNSDRAIESGQRALTIANACGDFSLRVLANTYLGQVYQSRGDYPRAIALFRSNVEALVGPLAQERLGVLQLPAVHSRTCLVWCLAELGAFAEGIAVGEAAIRIAESVEHPINLIVACSGIGAVYFRQGDLRRAIPVLERGVEVSRRWNVPLWFPRVASDLGAAYALSGRVADALPLLELAVERASEMRLRSGQSHSLAALSQGYVLAGRIGDALDIARRALALAQERGERGHEAWAFRLLGEIELQSTGPGHTLAEQHVRHALALAQELRMRPLVGHCLLALGQCAASAGTLLSAEEHFTAAHTLFVELDMSGWRARVEAELKSFRGP
jgi:class 3 adenylate cyclase/tetratricopeptide (TPR) repeat protein